MVFPRCASCGMAFASERLAQEVAQCPGSQSAHAVLMYRRAARLWRDGGPSWSPDPGFADQLDAHAAELEGSEP